MTSTGPLSEPAADPLGYASSPLDQVPQLLTGGTNDARGVDVDGVPVQRRPDLLLLTGPRW